MIAYEGPNADQIRYWNEVSGPQWVTFSEALSAQIRPFGLHALARLDVRPGERVLDIGCGAGETTAEIAKRVGPDGRVLGVDISEPLVTRAREVTANFAHAEIRLADAQTTNLDPKSFDALFSRFGVMFFSDPLAAFSNLHHALRPGGRMAFACWRALDDNPWMTVPAAATAKHIPVKRPLPNAPGPFAFADADRVRDFLEKAGFVNVKHEPIDESLYVAGGESIDGAVAMLMRVGLASFALREANATQEVADAVRASIRAAIAEFNTPNGVRMPAAVWLVSAQRST